MERFVPSDHYNDRGDHAMPGTDDLTKRFLFFLAIIVIVGAISYVNFQVNDDLFSKSFFSVFAGVALYFGFKLAMPPRDNKIKDIRSEMLKVASAVFTGIIQFYQKDFLKTIKALTHDAGTAVG